MGISLKDENLITISRQKTIEKTDLFQDISKIAIKLLDENYVEGKNIRAITLSVTNLESPYTSEQLSLFEMTEDKNCNNENLENITRSLDKLKEKYGDDKINFASIIRK